MPKLELVDALCGTTTGDGEADGGADGEDSFGWLPLALVPPSLSSIFFNLILTKSFVFKTSIFCQNHEKCKRQKKNFNYLAILSAIDGACSFDCRGVSSEPEPSLDRGDLICFGKCFEFGIFVLENSDCLTQRLNHFVLMDEIKNCTECWLGDSWCITRGFRLAAPNV